MLALLFFAGKLALGDLQVHLEDALFTRHVLVHLVDLVQILLQVLRLLLELKVVSGNAILELLVGVLDLVQLHFKLEDFLDTVEQVLMQLLLLGLVLVLQLVALLFYQTLLELDNVGLLLLELLLDVLL